MIADALQLIQRTAQEAGNAANKVAILDLPKDPNRFAIAKPDGSLEFFPTVPTPRLHQLESVAEIEQFVAFAKEDLEADPSIWISEEQVSIVLQDRVDSHRRDRAVVTLTKTQAHAHLAAISESWLDQKSFVRLLRIVLADAMTESTHQLLKVARVLSFKNFVTGHGKVEHGRASLGREIEEEIVSEMGDLPETVTFNVRLFSDPALTQRFGVGCAVDVNTRDGLFNLSPLAESLEDAVGTQLDIIYRMVTDVVDCPVFRGKP